LLEWPKSKELVADFVDQALALDRRERRVLLRQQAGREAGYFFMKLLRFQLAQLRQVHPVDQHPVQPLFHVLETLLVVFVNQGSSQSIFSD
jgi:hypothetical protein